MKTIFFTSLVLICVFNLSACNEVNNTIQTAESSKIQMTNTESETYNIYDNLELGYTLYLTPDFKVYTKDYDSFELEDKQTVWIGTGDPSFWRNGFYIRKIDNPKERIEEIKTVYKDNFEEINDKVGGYDAKRLIIGEIVEHMMSFYYIDLPTGALEIQVGNDNEKARSVINSLTIKF